MDDTTDAGDLAEVGRMFVEGSPAEGAGLDLRFLDRQACAGSDTCLLELRLRER